MKTPVLALFLALLPAMPAAAASAEDVYQQVETILGDAKGLDPFLEDVRRALVTGTGEDVAALAAFPLPVNNNGSFHSVETAEEFIAAYPRLVSQATKDVVAEAAYEDLLVTDEGVAIGDGAVWLSPVCEDNACAKSYWAIVSINN
ncbi:hypothetical protein V6L76_19350 [Pannonibacter sp. Pt2]|uniref:Uncharacterized protein n=1 Tax=Pannonibacter anstelovis TaxID=3121537 RepID=A0ABU7ZT64_9HYPH